MIRNAANSILCKPNPEEINPPPSTGDKWLQRFLKYHPEYYIRRRHALDINRKKAHEPEVLRDWFAYLIRMIAKYGIAK